MTRFWVAFLLATCTQGQFVFPSFNAFGNEVTSSSDTTEAPGPFFSFPDTSMASFPIAPITTTTTPPESANPTPMSTPVSNPMMPNFFSSMGGMNMEEVVGQDSPGSPPSPAPAFGGFGSLQSFGEGMAEDLEAFSTGLTQAQKEEEAEKAVKNIPDELDTEVVVESDDLDCSDVTATRQLVEELRAQLCEEGDPEDCFDLVEDCGSYIIQVRVKIGKSKWQVVLVEEITEEDLEELNTTAKLKRFAKILARKIKKDIKKTTNEQVKVRTRIIDVPPFPSPPSPPASPPPPFPNPPPPSPSPSQDSPYIEELCPDSRYENVAPECASDPSASNVGPEPTIIGGVDVDSRDYPYIVSLQSSYGSNCFWSFCGGSLIAPNLVLTAAHCVDGKSSFFVAQAPRCRHEGGFARVRTSSIIMHENYNFPANDIALVFLQESLPGPTVDITSSAALNLVSGSTVGLIGYGTSENPAGQNYYTKIPLQAAFDIEYRNQADCRWNVDYPTTICTETFPIVNNGCYGDSGGPLMYFFGSQPIQIGVTSYVIEGDRSFCNNGQAGYARVSYYLDWISTNSGISFNAPASPVVDADPPPSPPPPPPAPTSISSTDQDFLDAHVSVRSQVCPTLSTLSWDYTLALEASIIVNRCVALSSDNDKAFVYWNSSLSASSNVFQVLNAALAADEANAADVLQKMSSTYISKVGCALKTDCEQRFGGNFVQVACVYDNPTPWWASVPWC